MSQYPADNNRTRKIEIIKIDKTKYVKYMTLNSNFN